MANGYFGVSPFRHVVIRDRPVVDRYGDQQGSRYLTSGHHAKNPQRDVLRAEGIHARGGTRTGFQPVRILGSRGNMRNPSQSGRCTARSEAQSVDTVHTPISPLEGIRPTAAPRNEGSRFFFALTKDRSAGMFPRVCKHASREGMTGWLGYLARMNSRVFTAIQTLQPFHGLMAHVPGQSGIRRNHAVRAMWPRVVCSPALGRHGRRDGGS